MVERWMRLNGTRSARTTGGAVVAWLVLTALLASCGSSPEPANSPTPGSEAPAAEGAFPVTIAHRYGETTIEAPPKRVVTVGLTDQDAALAVGVVPVGTTEWFGKHPGAIWPWARDELGRAPVPEVVSDAATIGFEKIINAEPDLILAVYSGLTQEDYDKLSQIAPTVAQPGSYIDFGVPWDEQTLTIGKALGQTARAEAVVADLRTRFEQVKAAHPDFAGARAVVAAPYAGQVDVYAEQDVRGRLLASLGFVQPPEIARIASQGFTATLSKERLDLLDGDVIVWFVGSIAEDKPKFDQEPLYAGLRVHREGREVLIEQDSELGGALSFITPLSLPKVLDELPPKLADALAPGS